MAGKKHRPKTELENLIESYRAEGLSPEQAVHKAHATRKDREMPKTPRRPRDPNQLAKLIVGIAAGEEEDASPAPKNEAAVELGRKGGQKRAANMTPERRQEIARKAAEKRWSKTP